MAVQWRWFPHRASVVRGWFLQNLGKNFIWTNMHTTVGIHTIIDYIHNWYQFFIDKSFWIRRYTLNQTFMVSAFILGSGLLCNWFSDERFCKIDNNEIQLWSIIDEMRLWIWNPKSFKCFLLFLLILKLSLNQK